MLKLHKILPGETFSLPYAHHQLALTTHVQEIEKTKYDWAGDTFGELPTTPVSRLVERFQITTWNAHTKRKIIGPYSGYCDGIFTKRTLRVDHLTLIHQFPDCYSPRTKEKPTWLITW